MLGSASILCVDFAYNSIVSPSSCHSPGFVNPSAPARGHLSLNVAVGPGQAAARLLGGICFPFPKELHSSFSPWLWLFLELCCSYDPTDPAALSWLYPRPAFSPLTCLPVTELVAEPAACHQTLLL